MLQFWKVLLIWIRFLVHLILWERLPTAFNSDFDAVFDLSFVKVHDFDLNDYLLFGIVIPRYVFCSTTSGQAPFDDSQRVYAD